MAKLDDLVRTVAAGFRSLKNELRNQRSSIEQVQEAVVQYSRYSEERDERRVLDMQKLQAELEKLKRATEH